MVLMTQETHENLLFKGRAYMHVQVIYIVQQRTKRNILRLDEINIAATNKTRTR